MRGASVTTFRTEPDVDYCNSLIFRAARDGRPLEPWIIGVRPTFVNRNDLRFNRGWA